MHGINETRSIRQPTQHSLGAGSFVEVSIAPKTLPNVTLTQKASSIACSPYEESGDVTTARGLDATAMRLKEAIARDAQSKSGTTAERASAWPFSINGVPINFPTSQQRQAMASPWGIFI